MISAIQNFSFFFFKVAKFLFAGYLIAGAQLVTNNLDFLTRKQYQIERSKVKGQIDAVRGVRFTGEPVFKKQQSDLDKLLNSCKSLLCH